ncbi:carbon-nitrogen hydrolase [Puniceicoccus vermicola]|uniref:Carbon-nitrogen hydrolase n=1 Tax=Puniceicoccus vermicola TaxID=388746 RepID=A0A7X1B134_9BACT|nr:carbon-nitrogen hydrolase [Puniceicoccus vermicola]MBC2603617.1 carbon-nitrogen hydrolase [Puniceicoccus vermicola]
MSTKNTLALGVVQLAHSGSQSGNLARTEELVREAHSQGAQIILSPELIDGPYFCQREDPEWFDQAVTAGEGPGFQMFDRLSRELDVVLPYSFFERANQSYFNSLAVFDGDRGCLGVYRKSHIPDGPGYEEKFYFNGGDTGFRVFDTSKGRVGAAVCWDQWFPETARILALKGAECLLYPTAIGSEPEEPEMDSRDHWQRVMQGHSGANLMPVVASNRFGHEEGPGGGITFYGSSFITDSWGAVAKQLPRDQDGVRVAEFDRAQMQRDRANWGFFRDRRVDLYRGLLGLDGSEDSRSS